MRIFKKFLKDLRNQKVSFSKDISAKTPRIFTYRLVFFENAAKQNMLKFLVSQKNSAVFKVYDDVIMAHDHEAMKISAVINATKV